jgi:stearoyl-CoA desaturase (Delta-9 desaturase)
VGRVLNTPTVRIRQWISSLFVLHDNIDQGEKGIHWIDSMPFVLLHVAPLGVFWVGWSAFAVLFAVLYYLVRMFSFTAFYHRYFSHHAFTTNRFFQFLFAFLGWSAMQNGPLWWAASHRHHHIYADTDKDLHSPKIQGFLWSHIGWILAAENKRIRTEYVKDWIKYPELIFLENISYAIPIMEAAIILLIGHLLSLYRPDLNTNGFQLLVWGFFISTVVSSHATFSINSIDHMFGSRRYDMPNTSRNNVWTAILTLGEGWHNNHHHFPITALAGFYWWEIDITYYLLILLSWFGIVGNLSPLPDKLRDSKHLAS